jgi:hypothetical protein
MRFLTGSVLAIACGLWFILAPRSVIWFYKFLGAPIMEKATPHVIQVIGVVLILIILIVGALVELKIISMKATGLP